MSKEQLEKDICQNGFCSTERRAHCRLSANSYCWDVEIIAEKLYNAGYRKQSEWISVGDRLPDEDCLPMNCLVAAKVGDRVVVDWATRGIGWGYLSQKAETYWEILHDWDEGEGFEITHWMPLPEPPKMKGGETDA